MSQVKLLGFLLIGALLFAPTALADLPQAGDLVLGLSQFDATLNFELVREIGGTPTSLPVPWTTTNFVQSVEFDNFDGISHNANGNLLGASFGATATGGLIYNFATTAEVSDGQLLAEANGLGDLTLTRLAGLSVSRDNTKIAVAGADSGAVIVFDYVPGDTIGGGAALNNEREALLALSPSGRGQGTTWLDNNTVLGFSIDGSLITVDAASMATTFAGFVTTPFGGSDNTALTYNPDISPYVWAAFSTFSGGATTNKLYVLDPDNSFNLVNEIDLSTSSSTMREIAFNADGDLIIGAFLDPGAPADMIIDILPDAAANAATLTDNSSVDYYTTSADSSFNGLDVALGGGAPPIDGDFDNNGFYECADVNDLVGEIVAGTNNPAFDLTGNGTVDIDDLTAWRTEAGAGVNAPQLTLSGNPVQEGDANLDGTVDGQDFIDWNTSKFTSLAEWCSGDFNADGFVDGQDFIIWNTNKFTSADHTAVPEPATTWLVLVGLSVAGLARRRRG